MEKTTMSVQELSAQMGISLPKAYELVKTPGFPIIKVGTRILIPSRNESNSMIIHCPRCGSIMKRITNNDADKLGIYTCNKCK